MSRRTAESNKAIRLAWHKEKELVKEGKGTRDWTTDQQQDILEKGKAYDEDGYAFQGQHMKSAEKYPEYQNEPDNIQFLTRAEHFEAHDGNWRVSTNWYYNPVTKEKVDFGDGKFIPCEVIWLSNPIVIIEVEKVVEENKPKGNSNKNKERTNPNINRETSNKEHNSQSVKNTAPSNNGLGLKVKNGFKSAGKVIIEFKENHPKIVKSAKWLARIGITLIAVKKISDFSESNNEQPFGDYTEDDITDMSTDSSLENSDGDMLDDSSISYTPNDVPSHKQRYHTKDGVVWKDVDSYHRGGNADE